MLVSSVSDFHPDTKGAVVALFCFVFFFRLTCSVALWGVGTLQTNNTVVCSQCLSHTGPVPAHSVCSLPAHTAQALGCSAGIHPGLALGCMLLPGLSHSGSPQRHRLVWACVLCPSQVRAAQGMRCLVSVVAATYRLPLPCRSVFWVYNWRTFSGGC